MKLTVRLMGGLGNQLFQLCRAKKLCEETGRTLVLDTSWYESSNLSGPKRKYELSNFKEFDGLVNTKKSFLFYGAYLERVLRRIPRSIRNLIGYYFESDVRFVRNSKMKNVYIQGYWIDGKLADGCFESITLNPKLISQELQMATELVKSKFVISIHVRQSDYLEFSDIYGVLSDSYFLESVDLLRRQNHANQNEIQIIVFSDGNPQELIMKLEHLGYETKIFRDHFHLNDVQTFHVMSQAINLVCSNSTYSWWAGRLNSDPKKRVVFPLQYIRGIDSKSLNLLFDYFD